MSGIQAGPRFLEARRRALGHVPAWNRPARPSRRRRSGSAPSGRAADPRASRSTRRSSPTSCDPRAARARGQPLPRAITGRHQAPSALRWRQRNQMKARPPGPARRSREDVAAPRALGRGRRVRVGCVDGALDEVDGGEGVQPVAQDGSSSKSSSGSRPPPRGGSTLAGSPVARENCGLMVFVASKICHP